MSKNKVLTLAVLSVLFLAFFTGLNLPPVKAQATPTLWYGINSVNSNYLIESVYPTSSATDKAGFAMCLTVPAGEVYTVVQIDVLCKQQGTVSSLKVKAGIWGTDYDNPPGLYIPNSTGAPLATSAEELEVGGISTSNHWENFTFTGANLIELTEGVWGIGLYCTSESGNSDNEGLLYYHTTGGSAGTNEAQQFSSAWTASYHRTSAYVWITSSAPPLYSDVSNTAVNNGYSVYCSSYWTAPDADLDGWLFEHNATGSAVNATEGLFVDQSEDWANGTITLDGDLGDVVSWRFYANTTSGQWNVTDAEEFTISATVTFYFNTGGSLRRNGTSISNVSQVVYSEPTTLTFLAVPVAGGYAFDYFAWYAGTETEDTNPYNWTVDWATSFWCYFTDAGAATPPPYDVPVVDDDTVELTLYWQTETQTVGNVTGYGALESVPDTGEGVTLSDFTTAGNGTLTLAWRLYLQYSSGSATEITAGTPQAQDSIDWTDEDPVLLTGDYSIGDTSLSFGRTALKFYMYYRWNSTGDWTPAAIFVSDYLFYTGIEASTINITAWAEYSYADGVASVSVYWGGDDLAGVGGLYMTVPNAPDYQRYYLNSGNFLAFLTIPYTAIIGNAFYAIVLFGIGMSLYIRYRQASILAFFIIILGGSGAAGVINLLIGDLFMGVVWIVAAFGLALIFWRVFR